MPALYGAQPVTWQVAANLRQRKPPQASPVPTLTQRTWQFDPYTGDFVVDGNGKTPLTTPEDAVITWAAKTVTTQRADYLIYSRSYGADLRRAQYPGARPAVEQAVAANMRIAVQRDSRVKDLVDFAFDWRDQTALYIAYTIILSTGRRARSNVRLELL